MIDLKAILRNNIREYLRPDFPASRLENVVDKWFVIAEEKTAILEAMKEACNQSINRCIDEIVDEEDNELQQCIEGIRENLAAIKNEIK